MSQHCYDDEGHFLGCALPADTKLIAAGWEKRFLADTRMAKEAVENYGQLGFEVKLAPIKTETLDEECSGCKKLLDRFRMVYTRKSSVLET
ncbi:MAG: hypothetical protein ACE5IR_06830 [bacterium]